MNLVDPTYELIDPCPDIHALFLEYNSRFFEGRLIACEVKWSPRMTSCAGVCSYEGRSGLCSIRLSKPLLTLRPRKDLVETLLHEMIHAYLFVTQRNQDRDGHGPEFQLHMYRINKIAGTNITIYHSFHAEVRLYKVHHWRCNGPCQHRPPFRGWVKRASNRAPGPNDTWWARHQATCGGTFIKISEPPGYKSKTKNNIKVKEKPLNTLDNWVISPEKNGSAVTNIVSKKTNGKKGKPKSKPTPTKQTLDNWMISPDKKQVTENSFEDNYGKVDGMAGGPSLMGIPREGGQKLGGTGSGRSRLLDIINDGNSRNGAAENNKSQSKNVAEVDIIVLDDDEDEYWANVDEHPTMDEWVPSGQSGCDLDETNLQIVNCPICGIQEYYMYIAQHMMKCTDN